MTGKEEPEKATKSLINEGAKLVIVSRGEKGLIAGTKEVVLKMPAFKAQLIDPTGAGDACVTAVGTTTAVTREKVDELLKEQSLSILNQALASLKENIN